MKAWAGTIEVLRASLLPAEETRRLVPLGHGPADAALSGGLRASAVHEVYAGQAGHEAAASGFALSLAIRACGRKWLLWIRQDFSALEAGEVSASGLLELGADPARVLLFRAAHIEDALRTAAEGFACASLGALVVETCGPSKLFDLSLSRRLALAAARHETTAILLRSAAMLLPSAAETRWQVRAARSNEQEENWGTPLFDAELLRNRHGTTGHWTMEWNADECSFRECEAHPCGVAAEAAGRPAEAARRRHG